MNEIDFLEIFVDLHVDSNWLRQHFADAFYTRMEVRTSLN